MKFGLMAFCMAVLLILPLASAQTLVTAGEIVTTPWTELILTSQSPYPVEPGENVNIEIEIQNSGTSARDFTIEIVAKDPFTLLPGEEVEKTFSSIPSRGSVKTSYRMFVDTEAITNLYEIEFRLYTGTSRDSYVTQSINVNVQGTPELILEDLQLSDGVPGGEVNLTATVSNIGTGTARDMKLVFASTEELLPLLSQGSVYVGDLEPGQTKTAVIGLSIDESAEQKTYTSTITAEYKDESNTMTENDFSVGIPIKGSVSLEVIKIEPDFRLDKLKIEVANKGTTEAKSLEAKLYINDELVDVEYSSSLKATKKTTFSFPLVLQGTGKLTIDYTGPGMDKNQMVKDITLNFFPQSDGGAGTTLLVIIVVVIVAVIAWKKRLFRKKK